VPALLGRSLVAAAEQEGAAPVVVIGYELWRRRFSADHAVVGRDVRFGDSTRIVVGVMPEGFAFPVSHSFWVPLRNATLAGGPRQGGLPRAMMREPGEWYEIVGVVKNIGMDTTRDAFASGEGPGVYHPLTPAAVGADGLYAVRVAFHVNGDAGAFASKLRELAHAVNPAMRLDDVLRLDGPIDRVSRAQRTIGRVMASATALVALIALLISIAGTYSVMSFAVARHTREIGIRIALGASRRRILAGVFSRAIVQIATGIVLGAFFWFYIFIYRLGRDEHLALFLVSAGALALVGIVACGLPVRRALSIEPTEALRQLG